MTNKHYFCIYCEKLLLERSLFHKECFNSEFAIKQRRYSFLSSFVLRTDDEEKEVHDLKHYFVSINRDPGWQILERKLY